MLDTNNLSKPSFLENPFFYEFLCPICEEGCDWNDGYECLKCEMSGMFPEPDGDFLMLDEEVRFAHGY